ncbi:hypothetical protein DL95DRAFT_396391 [Leptodontidium sp. 2 PMI_412]|nr:hypothetical protein DL95DRAFT_396391 [Leptodontidium sp. 2 PMI_412]
MGNVTSSLNGSGLNSLANVIDEVRSNPTTILDLLSIYNAKLALFISHTTSDMRLHLSDVLSSLLVSGRDIATSLSGMVKEAGSRPLPANISSFTRKQWQRVITLIPVFQNQLVALIITWGLSYMASLASLCLLGGFGIPGPRRNSLASKYQSRAYGGFTPKGGIFANSTSAGMRGRTPLIYKAIAVVVASSIMIAVYKNLDWEIGNTEQVLDNM